MVTALSDSNLHLARGACCTREQGPKGMYAL
ncbi:predicted protein [Sclerotinia sclerotiorum 1980 UF-70]|uniref:Uncharacterized protein n=1 Tax=Sclerotinia sclerotiorum (strain ATCC 18683 / 1980 / Ss-1) TaxID=665079 RepID=A7EIV5_SCLS1|nr:predicted protein [Sclerotinia sclerotiorum 1980 UF-70]EDO02771.1 predicted protein [Sclerotinia sclerotiorum 1980 UF-70]